MPVEPLRLWTNERGGSRQFRAVGAVIDNDHYYCCGSRSVAPLAYIRTAARDLPAVKTEAWRACNLFSVQDSQAQAGLVGVYLDVCGLFYRVGVGGGGGGGVLCLLLARAKSNEH